MDAFGRPWNDIPAQVEVLRVSDGAQVCLGFVSSNLASGTLDARCNNVGLDPNELYYFETIGVSVRGRSNSIPAFSVEIFHAP